MMIRIIHNSVKGRSRYHVQGLYRNEPLKKFLELRLSQENSITKVSANPLAGNLLVSFNTNETHESVGEWDWVSR
jgi:hypothetical protein